MRNYILKLVLVCAGLVGFFWRVCGVNFKRSVDRIVNIHYV